MNLSRAVGDCIFSCQGGLGPGTSNSERGAQSITLSAFRLGNVGQFFMQVVGLRPSNRNFPQILGDYDIIVLGDFVQCSGSILAG